MSIIDKICAFLFSCQRIDEVTCRMRFLGIRIRLKKMYTNSNRLSFLEKKIIKESIWWNPEWYCRKYHYRYDSNQAFDYWVTRGWKKGESPSPYINVKYFRGERHHINPILRYMSRDIERNFFPDNKNNFRHIREDEIIASYLKHKNTRKAKLVVYTCITNDYDDLSNMPTHYYAHKDADYVCFTDNETHIKSGQVGIWQIRPLEYTRGDSTRNNRWHKTHPHVLFPEYEESIYIDSNINILSDYLFKVIKQTGSPLVLPKHPKNICIYSEYKDVTSAKLDSLELIIQERKILEDSGMPENYGFCENNVLFRKHHDANIKNMMDEWWNMITNYSKRDQLSLVYILWKNGILPQNITFENTRFLINDFYVFGHQKGR